MPSCPWCVKQISVLEDIQKEKYDLDIFKIYNKSNQYGMSENVLRIELKIEIRGKIRRIYKR